ncbi:MAG: glycosyltransferase family 39 protein [Phycisphaerae bacterium]|jgi:hypothetical protein
MNNQRSRISRVELAALSAVLMLFTVLSVVGMTWGLPSRGLDRYLFGGGAPWSGEKIYRLAGAGEKFLPTRGADVDADPLDKGDEPILLTGSDEDVAKIYLRYRLYTYQPDEMITMMALAGMRPGKLQLDPKLYQYGGLFIYPVGALIGACGVAGLIDVRSDVPYYLDNPDEFGKFYIVARGYAAAWGVVGAMVVFAMARRLGGRRTGVLSALLFTLMPVVVCMAHEGKPHLPGAVLMLTAVLFAMRHLSGAGRTPPSPPSARGGGMDPVGKRGSDGAFPADWWWMCVCCGAAFGMVLSSWPIFVLIPLVAVMDWRQERVTLVGSRYVKNALVRTVLGVSVGVVVYLLTNPYTVINLLTNRAVLASNFGNSFAMYEIARIAEGFTRVIELTVEGATLPVLGCGVIALVVALVRKNDAVLPLVVVAAVFFLQFVAIGAGKPAEYGRFGVFTNTALAIGTACLLAPGVTRLRDAARWVATALVVLWVAYFGGAYLYNFRVDATDAASRLRARRVSAFGPYLHGGTDTWLESGQRIAQTAEPAPYCCPPLPFDRARVYLVPDDADVTKSIAQDAFRWVRIAAVDEPGALQAAERIHSGDDGDRPRPWEADEDLTAVAQRGTQTFVDRLYRGVATPISWANKPFAVTAGGWRVTP